MKMAYSPCPNDTYIFHAWSHGLLPEAPPLEVVHADIDRTNEWALDESTDFDLLKISYAALPAALDRYALLPCGGALGEGCGPLLLTRREPTETIKKIAVPSNRSTAYLLFRLWLHEQQGMQQADMQIDIVPFAQIMPAVARGAYDAGLVIHEARFTYEKWGLHKQVDFGDWWERTTGMLIPLGAIVARRSLDVRSLTHWIRASIDFANRQPQASLAYRRQHAQEMDADVMAAHINLYVNAYSYDIGPRGQQSVEHLFSRAFAAGLFVPFALTRLWHID